MRSVMVYPMTLVAAVALAACDQGGPINPSTGGVGSTAVQTGNGGPSGAHYNLNLIGVPREKTADMTGSNGHRIFVALQGNTKILLGEGDAFQVIDANGTDGEASFELPDPDPENDGVSEYSVFARELGKPGGGGSIETCATDPVSGDIVCSIETLTLSRGKGKSTFRNVSRELLYIYYDLDGDGTAERFPLFDDALEGYFWDFDNNGLKVVQLRFYPCTTNVETGETSCF